MLTTMQEIPLPQKKPCRTRVSLLSLKGTIRGGLDLATHFRFTLTSNTCFRSVACILPLSIASYLLFWLCLKAAMQRPSVRREVLMLLASFILSPLRCSLQRSDPARSHTVSLRMRQHLVLLPQKAKNNHLKIKSVKTYSLMCMTWPVLASG